MVLRTPFCFTCPFLGRKICSRYRGQCAPCSRYRGQCAPACHARGREKVQCFILDLLLFFKKKIICFRGSCCNQLHLCPKRGLFFLFFAQSWQAYSPRAWGGGSMLAFAGARQVPASWSAAPLLPLLFLQTGLFLTLPCVLTLLFPFGSPALCLAEPSQPAAKEKPLGSWRSPLPRGHAWGEQAGAKMQPRALWGSCTAHSQQN